MIMSICLKRHQALLCCWPSFICGRRFASTSKSYYITTPIFYPNASPHIGHLYTLVAGDVFARYQRLRRRLPSSGSGAEGVHLLTGTDEHGMKIQRTARKHFGMPGREKEFCDSLTKKFRDLGTKALISNTCFMRTTSDDHKRTVEDVWRKLLDNGYIYKGNYSGWYSVTDECFYTDSQVTRVAAASASHRPSSASTPTSTSMSNLTPRAFQTTSTETGSPVEWTEEENYMFRLGAFRDDLLHYYQSNKRSIYPEQYREDVLNMLGAREGNSFSLDDISISRPRSRLEWGIQVPGDPSQTVYVWFDALLIYLTGSGYPWSSSPRSVPEMGPWPADLQVIGKDILRFHAIYLPAILRALSTPSSANTEVDIPLSRTILVHAHWTSSQKKMSKSLGNVADPLDAIDKWGVDIVRFYLMRIGGRWRDDVDWSPSQLDKHRKEIQSQLGNYFLRITSPRLVERVVPSVQSGELTLEGCLSKSMRSLVTNVAVNEPQSALVENDGRYTDPNYELLKAVLSLPEKVRRHMDTFEAGSAIGEIMTVLRLANRTLSDIAPWSPDTSPALIHTTRIIALETVRVVGACIEPFMPTVSSRLRDALAVDIAILQDGIHRIRGRNEAESLWNRWTGHNVKGVRLI